MRHMCRPSTIRQVFVGMALAASLTFAANGPTGPSSGSAPGGSADLRPAFKKWGLTPRVQGKRNTCSVFTVAGALEYAVASKTNRTTRFSVEFLNWASNRATRDKHDGSFFSDLWRGFTVYGACPEQDMPYQDKFDPNRAPSEEAKGHAKQMHEAGLQLHWIKRWDPNTGLTDAQLGAIKPILHRQWPVCGGFRWPKQVKWKDDVLEMAPPEGVFDGHSVLLVGYRDDSQQPGGGMFLFRNSNNNGRD
ncbi:MAG: hypothetical protein EHM35_08720, partial [Planctomycetaceae bacterium]